MTAKTTHKRAKSKFDMTKIRRRCKKMVRKRYKKTIGLKKVDAVWKDWVEYMIVRPLIKNGFVQVDKKMSLEIVGKKVVKSKNIHNLLSHGIMVMPNGMIKKVGQMNRLRSGIVYRIEMTDKNFKEGKLIFTADKRIKRKVRDELMNTNTYYRIEQ